MLFSMSSDWLPIGLPAAWPCSVCQPACLWPYSQLSSKLCLLLLLRRGHWLLLSYCVCIAILKLWMPPLMTHTTTYIYINNWNDRCYWENYYNTHSTYIMIHSKGHSSLQFMFEALWTTICPSPALPCSILPSQAAVQPASQQASLACLKFLLLMFTILHIWLYIVHIYTGPYVSITLHQIK